MIKIHLTNTEIIQHNLEYTNHTNQNSPMTTLTNFHNFSERTINIEEMTYEELIDLQDRIGYVNKGLSYEEIQVFLQFLICVLFK